jgi:hypothetical protein
MQLIANTKPIAMTMFFDTFIGYSFTVSGENEKKGEEGIQPLTRLLLFR